MAPQMKKPGPAKNNFQKPANTRKTFTRLLGYLGKSKFLLLLVFVFVLFSSLASIIGTSFVKTITDDILLPLVGSPLTKETLAPLVEILTTIGIVYLFGVVSSYSYSRIMLQVSQKTLNIIRKDLFNRMQDLPIKFFDTHTHGELMSRYTSDVDTLRECISQSFVQLCSSLVSVIGIRMLA